MTWVRTNAAALVGGQLVDERGDRVRLAPVDGAARSRGAPARCSSAAGEAPAPDVAPHLVGAGAAGDGQEPGAGAGVAPERRAAPSTPARTCPG